MSDIVERMRAMANDFASDLAWCDEAAGHIEAQAERIRVLREALNVATNWLSEDRCPLGWTVSRLRDTIEATK